MKNNSAKWLVGFIALGFAGMAVIGSRVYQDIQDRPVEITEPPLSVEPFTSPAAGTLAALGEQISKDYACSACHSDDGSRGIGPSWTNLYGSTRTFTDGSSAIADDAYLRESILDPTAKIVEFYIPTMPVVPLSENQIEALIAYAKANSSYQIN